MQAGEFWRRRGGLRVGLLGGGLVLCALMARADVGRSDAAADPAAAPLATADDLRRGFQQLSRQVGQLQQATAQAGRAQLDQGDALRQQAAGIERSQRELGAQLASLQGRSLQQVEALQVANRQLVIVLWALAGLGLLLALLAWRWRPAARAETHVAQQPAASARQPVQLAPRLAAPPAPAAPASPVAPAQAASDTALAGIPEAAGIADIAAASDASATPADVQGSSPDIGEGAPQAYLAPAASTPVYPEPSPAQTSPWSALVAADMLSTEQALAQARQGFMQSVRIDS